jgi:hypothetical protein
MRDERFEVSVTFNAERGYVASAPELRQPIVALSLASLRKRIEIAMLPDSVDVRFMLDGRAERERHRRRAQAQLGVRMSVIDVACGLSCHAQCHCCRSAGGPASAILTASRPS